MRKTLLMLAVLAGAAFGLASCAQAKTQDKEDKQMKANKTLVVFYSRAGENYSVGNVKVGNTQVLAELIAAQTGADTFQVKPTKAYPDDYTECTEVSKKELESKARPDIVADFPIDDYDTIFIGYPIWWGDAPMPLYTFIEKHSWQGKTVIPFCTHEGSGYCNEAEITEACKGATVLQGLGMYGHTAQNDRSSALKTVQKWLKGLNL